MLPSLKIFDYQLLGSKFKTIFYKEITSIKLGGYSSNLAEKKVPTLRINFVDVSFSHGGDVFFNVENVRNKYTTPIITERIL